MNLRKAISKETITTELKANTKQGVIEELIDLLDHCGLIHNRKAALKAVMDREKKMSTGMQEGIAIPHGKVKHLDTLVCAIGIKKEGIPFDALDGKPSQIVVLTLTPSTRTGPHIQFLAEISHVLNNPEQREKILAASTPEEIYACFIA